MFNSQPADSLNCGYRWIAALAINCLAVGYSLNISDQYSLALQTKQLVKLLGISPLCSTNRHIQTCKVYDKSGYSELSSTLPKCEWSQADGEFLGHTWDQKEIWAQPAILEDPDGSKNLSISSERCLKNSWSAFRFGPFITTGGDSWTRFTGHLSRDALPFYRGPLIALSHVFLGSVNSSGSAIGYPPLHQHHWHFDPQHMLWEDVSNHGESQCSSSEGGVGCYLKVAPDGYAFFFRIPIVLSNDFNDVRPMGSGPLQSWLIAVAKPVGSETQVRQFSYRSSTSWMKFSSVGPMSDIEPNPECPGVAICIRTKEVSVAWNHVTMLWGNATLFEAIAHAHWPMVADVLVFQGKPSEVFMSPFAMPPKNRAVYGREAVRAVISSIVMRNSHQNAARFMCSFRSSFEVEYVQGKAFQRRPRCILDTSLSSVLTMVAFFEPQLSNLAATFGMHVDLRVYLGHATDSVVLPQQAPPWQVTAPEVIQIPKFSI